MKPLLVASIGLLAGCDVVFPLGPTPPAPDAPVTSTDTGVVTGRWPRVVATSDQNGAPSFVTVEPERLAYTVHVMDGSTREVTATEGGRFSFTVPTPGAPYRLERADDLETIEIQDSQPNLDLVQRWLGLPHATDFDDPALELQPATEVSGGSVLVASTGYWTESPGIVSPDDTWQFHWRDAARLDRTGPLGLLAGNDRLYYLELETIDAGGTTRIHAVASGRVAMAATGTMPVLGSPSTITPIDCLQVSTAVETELDAVGAALPAHFNATPAADWHAFAGPDFSQFGPLGLLQLGGAARATNLDRATYFFANPYPGTQVVVSVGVNSDRKYQLPSAPTTALVARGSYGVRYYHAAGTVVTGCPEVTVDGGMELVTAIALDGTPLVDDGTALAIAGRPVLPVTWEVRGTLPAQFYRVAVQELRLDATATRHELVTLETIVTPTPALALPTAQLEAGHAYVLVVTGVRGYPGVDGGDYAQLDGTVAAETHFASPWFEVTP